MEIIQILEGKHHLVESGENMLIDPHTSAVTLVKVEGKNILIDTGSRGYADHVLQELAKNEINAENIDMVILTHFHLDHCYNISIFKKAKVIGWRHFWEEKKTVILKDIEGMEVAKGVTIFTTPGHALEHISVLIDDGKKKTVVAGDAMNHKYFENKDCTAGFQDKELFRQSADKILLIADEIIPGHGKKIQL